MVFLFLIYLLFLAIMGVPVLSMEFAVGRASRKSPVKAYQVAGEAGQQVASAWICGAAGQLCINDVLHYGSRMDAVLFL